MPWYSSASVNELLEFSDDFHVYREITNIDIRSLMDFPFDVKYFPNHDMDEFAMMRASIENHGL